jgi:hypothetical protein
MRIQRVTSATTAILLLLMVAAGGARADQAIRPTPKLVIEETTHSFAPVVDGTIISHDFLVGNAGEEVLKISKVQTGCGCAVASYPRQIPPGGEGKISIQFNTSGYGGRDIQEIISVSTDDPQRPRTTLTMRGKVNAFVMVTPRYARLNGKVGDPVTAVVRITPAEAYPFKITAVKAKSGQHITYELAQPSEESEGAYLLTVTNTKKEAGRYADTITIKTDSKVRSELKVGVYGYLSDNKKKTAKKPIPTKTDG